MRQNIQNLNTAFEHWVSMFFFSKTTMRCDAIETFEIDDISIG